jgi:hypothetical protein
MTSLTFGDIEAFLPRVREFLETARNYSVVYVYVSKGERIQPGRHLDDFLSLSCFNGKFRLSAASVPEDEIDDFNLTPREAIQYAYHFIRASRDNRRNKFIDIILKGAGRTNQVGFSRLPANMIENGNNVYYRTVNFSGLLREFITSNINAIANGNRNALHQNTEFIGANFIPLNNRPSANTLKDYVYLQSELQNGRAPRAYHYEGLRRWLASGRSTNPFSREYLTRNNMRKL